MWNSDFWKISPYASGRHFPKSCSPWKMMQNRIDEIFWGQPFKNTPYFNLRDPDFWKPLTSDYVAQGCFPQKKGPPYFWKPLTFGYVAQGFFFRQRGPIFLEAPNLWVRCSRLFFPQKNGPRISGSRFLEIWKSGTWKSGNLGSKKIC